MKLFTTSTGTNVVVYEPGRAGNTFPYEGMILYHVGIQSFMSLYDPNIKLFSLILPLPIGIEPTQTDAVLLESQLRSIPMSLENPSYKDLHRLVGDRLLNLTTYQWHVLLKSVRRAVGLDTEGFVISATEAASQRKQITELINHLWIEGNHLWTDGDSQEFDMPEEESNQHVYDLLISHITAVAPHVLY